MKQKQISSVGSKCYTYHIAYAHTETIYHQQGLNHRPMNKCIPPCFGFDANSYTSFHL